MKERGRPRVFDRDAALARAMELFWAKGYEGASLAGLTAAMGIRSPSLYAAFGSKEALYREALALYVAEGNAGIWDAIPGAPTAREAVDGFLRATAIAFTRPGTPPGCMIALGALHEGEASEAICRDLRERRAWGVGVLKARLERGVSEGELPAGADCEAIASFYATVQHGMSILARDGADREALLAVAGRAMAGWEGVVGPSFN